MYVSMKWNWYGYGQIKMESEERKHNQTLEVWSYQIQ